MPKEVEQKEPKRVKVPKGFGSKQVRELLKKKQAKDKKDKGK